MIILLVALLAVVSGHNLEEPYGNIVTCDVHYVKPGDDFEIPCHTDNGIQTLSYVPSVEVPSHEELVQQNMDESAERIQGPKQKETLTKYRNAQKGVDDGWYTCVVFHGTEWEVPYSTARCLVVIEDVCEGKCEATQACHADYPSGDYECNCDFGCDNSDFVPVCSDRCEQFVHPCYMQVETCKDGLDRNEMTNEFCFNVKTDPLISKFDDELLETAGETLVLTSGLMEESPAVKTTWNIELDSGETATVTDVDTWNLVVGDDTVGDYTITLEVCRDPAKTVVNKVSLKMKEPPSEEPAPQTALHYTCSVYPGGAIEQFDGESTFYDMACTHVLAADIAPMSGNAWYIYGTFDDHDGNTALAAMTFYVGSAKFEIQRGWIVNVDGEKMPLTENEEPVEVPGGSGCTVRFTARHLHIDCADFIALYDGIMAGHISLKPGVLEPHPPYVKQAWNLGLCNDGQSGFRPNWQVGKTTGDCEVDTEKPQCEEEGDEECAALARGPALETAPWSKCGGGATLGCNEISCGEGTPTPAQRCALEQARRISCALVIMNKVDLEGDGLDDSCPESCTWKFDVVSRGCVQERLPFQDCIIGSY